MTPKCKTSDAYNSDMPVKSYKVLRLSEKVNILHFRREKKLVAEIAKVYSNHASSMKLRRRTKKYVLVFLLHLQLQKLGSQGMIKWNGH